MSVSYHAYAVLGVRIPRKRFFRVERKKAFDHNCPEDWQVDPKTGKQLWCDSDPIPVVPLEESAFDTNSGTIYYTQGTNDCDEYVYVGLTVSVYGDNGGSAKLKPGHDLRLAAAVEDTKTKLEAFLLPAGLWAPLEFGIWSVLVCSY